MGLNFGVLAKISGMAVGAALLMTHPVQAREISDYEAGKLTFDALTSVPAPVVHHVSYRHSIGRNERVHHAFSRRAMVRDVVYHPKQGAHLIGVSHHHAVASHHRKHT